VGGVLTYPGSSLLYNSRLSHKILFEVRFGLFGCHVTYTVILTVTDISET